MVQLADLFSVPEMSLLCNIAEYFEQHDIHYHPEILFQDVKVRRSKLVLKLGETQSAQEQLFFRIQSARAIGKCTI